MGGLFHAIGDAIGSFIGAVWEATKKLLETTLDILKDYVIEPIMNFLGFHDEDIYHTSVIAAKIYSEDTFKTTQLRNVLEYMKKESVDALAYANKFSEVGDKQFGKYYRNGKWYYIDYLPEAQINAITIDTDAIRNILTNIKGNIFINDVLVMVPFDEDWCKYQLQELYGYDIGKDIVKINNEYYKYNNEYYDTDNNNFKVTLDLINVRHKRTYQTIDVTILPLSDTKEVERTNTYIYYQYSRVDNGNILYETTPTLISSIDKEIPKDTGLSSNNLSILGEETETLPVSNINLIISNHNNVRRYIVKYHTTDNGDYFYWIYNPESNVYPSLTSPINKVVGFDMYPITMLRNNYFNVEDYDLNEKDGHNRPPSVTKERYKSTIDILNSLGLSLSELTKGYSENADIDKMQDAFFMLGISPSNAKEIVSIVLYELFDFIYDRLPYSSGDSAYSAAFKENPYNAAIAWLARTTKIEEEKIGNLGTCKHEIKEVNLITRKYSINNTQYGDDFDSSYMIKVSQSIVEETWEDDELISTKTSEVKSFTIWNGENYDEETGEVLYPEGYSKKLKEETSKKVKNLIVKKQIEANVTKTLTMFNFSSLNIIRRGVSNGGVSLEVDDENLVIPLPVPVVERLTLMQKSALLGESCYLMFYALEKQHIKWYQTKAFSTFLQVVCIVITIVITIVSFGSLTGESIALTTVLISALKAIAIGVGLQLALMAISKLVHNIGLQIALSVAAMALAAWTGGGFSGFDGMSFAGNLVELPSKAINLYTQDLTNNLQNDMKKYQSEYEKISETNSQILKSFESGLTSSDIVNLMTPSEAFNPINLSPSQFYGLATNAYLEYDWLYSGYYKSTVSEFVKNKLKLDIDEDYEDE